MKGYKLEKDNEKEYIKKVYDTEFKNNYIPWSIRLKHADYRFKWAVQRLHKKSVLDYGCNDGIFLQICKAHGYRVSGYDISQEALDMAKSKLQNEAVLYNDEQFSKLKDSQFDNVCCFEVVEHTDNPEEIVTDLFRLCKDKGRVLITVPIGNTIPDHLHKTEFDWYKLTELIVKYTPDYNIFTINKHLESGTLNVFGIVAIKHDEYKYDKDKTVEENVSDQPISSIFKFVFKK